MKKILLVLSLVLLFFGGTDVFSCEVQSEQIKKITEQIATFGTPQWEKAIEVLVEIGEPAVEPLVRAMGDYSGHRYKPYRAALALGRCERKRIGVVIVRLAALRSGQGPGPSRSRTIRVGPVESSGMEAGWGDVLAQSREHLERIQLDAVLAGQGMDAPTPVAAARAGGTSPPRRSSAACRGV